MGIKKSVYLNDNTVKMCELLTAKYADVSWSTQLNKIAEHYSILIEAALPELAEGEKLALCALFNGHAWQDDLQHDLQSFTFNIYDGLKYDGNAVDILTQHQIDVEAFKNRCVEFSAAEKMAVMHMINQFWKNA